METHFHFTVLGMNYNDRMRILQELLTMLGRRDSIRLDVIHEPQPQPQAQQQIANAQVDNSLKEENCMICFSTTPDIKTPCDHRACQSCIERWLRRQNTCPNPFCRRPCTSAELRPNSP